MFKFFLNLNNETTYKGCYELHKKNCPIAKSLLADGDDRLVELGFFNTSSEAVASAKAFLASRDLDPSKFNGCLACCKECHER